MKILANDGISPSGVQKLEANGFEVITDNVPQDKLVDYINSNDVVALLVRSATTVRKELIDACPGLKFIGRGGVGMDNIDVEYARSIGRSVNNTPAASSQSVAELVMGHLFTMARHLHDSNREMPESEGGGFKVLKKKYAKGIELRGKTLGIIGFGRIGQATAKYALGCGMSVVAVDGYSPVDGVEISIAGVGKPIQVPVPNLTMEELLAKSDFISLHVPKQADGSAVIGEAEFAKMKDGACLVNAARGGVVNEDALLSALASGRLKYAALDVFDNEPNPRKDLLVHERIALTPHIGAATVEAQDRIGTELADSIITYFKG